MLATKRVSREEIIDAALEVLREGGFAAVNARSVARKAGCSTQPIYLSFQNMEELKRIISERAVAIHVRRVRDILRRHDDKDSCYSRYSRYSSYGIGFVKFAAEEKQLFRWLYLEGEQSGPYRTDVLLPEIIRVMEEEFGYSGEVAEKLHQDMVYYSYGLAILANTNHLEMTDTEILEAFRREFRALAAYYGVSAGQPEAAR